MINKNNEQEIEKLEQYDYIDDEYMSVKEDDYAYHIWLFFIRFSWLEHEINISLSDLIQDWSHEIGYSIIEWLFIGKKLDLYNRLAKKYISIIWKEQEKNLVKLKDIIKDIKDLYEFRNTLAHSYWLSMKKWGWVRVSFSSDKYGVINVKSEKILPRNIKAKITQIKKTIEKFSLFNDKIKDF